MAKASRNTVALPTGFENAIIVQVAMDEEAAPFFELTDSAGESFTSGIAEFSPRVISSNGVEQKILLVRSRIGLVNASTAITRALMLAPDSPLVVSAGTAGGLHTSVNVGDLVIGTDYTFTDADATAFGYARGQVPGMPEKFVTEDSLFRQAQSVELNDFDGVIHAGTMLAGGSFVTAHNVADTRIVFPEAISTDMETTAIAQVCANEKVPFIATRAISDLCGPTADQVFHLEIDIVAPLSAQLALAVIEKSASARTLESSGDK